MSKDIVVIEGGASGLCAAISAAEKGVSVVIYEKRRVIGGISNLGMGIFL